jgi:hypothetical protein
MHAFIIKVGNNEWTIRKVKVLSHYKFYLAFENYAIEDYVSEKVKYSIIFFIIQFYDFIQPFL